MWGSTTPNTADECTWSNAPFNHGSSSYNETYFNSVKDTVCPNGILAKEYDTTAQIMGSDWRMPTEDDFQELIANTSNAWIENYNTTGVKGWKFTSKKDSSKYIFIPAAGYCGNGSVYGVGKDGYVWSSSLHASSPDRAWLLGFNSGRCSMRNYNRYYGQSVRGVRK